MLEQSDCLLSQNFLTAHATPYERTLPLGRSLDIHVLVSCMSMGVRDRLERSPMNLFYNMAETASMLLETSPPEDHGDEGNVF